ncbi:hypothetical protein GCM10009798_05840 [Nocardioides panacihumi]|uniref:Uncharacterized protein n=1 Tax=Nocardioides panacihumi TaxID=400774 RepID=A0ABP5BNA1_9ACTN
MRRTGLEELQDTDPDGVPEEAEQLRLGVVQRLAFLHRSPLPVTSVPKPKQASDEQKYPFRTTNPGVGSIHSPQRDQGLRIGDSTPLEGFFNSGSVPGTPAYLKGSFDG